MARSFNGSTQFARTTVNNAGFNIQANAACSVSLWLNTTAATQQGIFGTWLFNIQSGWGIDIGALLAGTIDFFCFTSNASVGIRARSTATFNDGNWHNAVSTYDGSLNFNNVLHYKDGVNGQTTAGGTNSNPGALTNAGLTAGGYENSAAFVGSLAELAIWNVVLTAGEALALAKGALPYTIRASALTFWAPLDGLRSPEPDLGPKGFRNNMTLTAAPPLVAGPPVMPFTPRWPQGLDVVSAPAFNPAWRVPFNQVVSGGVAT